MRRVPLDEEMRKAVSGGLECYLLCELEDWVICAAFQFCKHAQCLRENIGHPQRMLCELLYPMKDFEWVSIETGGGEGDNTTYDLVVVSYQCRSENKGEFTTRIDLLHAPKLRCCAFLRSECIKSRLVMLSAFRSKTWKTVQCFQSTKMDENYSAIGASRYLARFELFQNIVKHLRFRVYPSGPRLYFSPDTVG